jgi:hypothetical protein
MMKEILALIESKKRDFSQLPFFEYLQDRSIAPKQRLAFAPCAAPFIMSFGELNRLVFRDEPTNDPIQTIINKHTYEDDHHWLWFLEDLEKLKLNPSEPFTKTLELLWSKETSASRRVAYELYHHTVDAEAIQKLIAIECVEATGNTFLASSSKLIRELQNFPEQEYRFFGAGHLIVDTGHTYCSPEAKQLIEIINLTEASKKESIKLIEHIFAVFTNFVNELLIYSQSHCLEEASFDSTVQYNQSFKPIGSYLVEAGLIKSEQLQEALNQQKSTPIPIGHILVNQGWVRQQTIEYLMEKVVSSERELMDAKSDSSIQRQSDGKNNLNSFSNISAFSNKSMLIGDHLVNAALVSPQQIQEALEEQKSSAIPLGQILSRKGLVNQQTIEYLMEKIVLSEQKTAILN